jgi:hypothetical protein
MATAASGSGGFDMRASKLSSVDASVGIVPPSDRHMLADSRDQGREPLSAHDANVCIHRHGWQLTLHPDGTTEARSPDGKQILYSHAPPAQNAA